MLGKQQNLTDMTPVAIWEAYFPYELENKRVAGRMGDPFIGLLRYSFCRPRDIIQYLQLMQAYVKDRSTRKATFSKKSFYICQIDFSNYLLGEVKDYFSFYHSTVDFDEVVGFFSGFGGNSAFTYEEFQGAFDRHSKRLKGKPLTIKELTSSSDDLPQFLYALNVIGYTEHTISNGVFVHYGFRDRTTVKLRPKVKFNLEYQVHPGLQRALLVGGVNTPARKLKLAPSTELKSRRRARAERHES